MKDDGQQAGPAQGWPAGLKPAGLSVTYGGTLPLPSADGSKYGGTVKVEAMLWADLELEGETPDAAYDRLQSWLRGRVRQQVLELKGVPAAHHFAALAPRVSSAPAVVVVQAEDGGLVLYELARKLRAAEAAKHGEGAAQVLQDTHAHEARMTQEAQRQQDAVARATQSQTRDLQRQLEELQRQLAEARAAGPAVAADPGVASHPLGQLASSKLADQLALVLDMALSGILLEPVPTVPAVIDHEAASIARILLRSGQLNDPSLDTLGSFTPAVAASAAPAPAPAPESPF